MLRRMALPAGFDVFVAQHPAMLALEGQRLLPRRLTAEKSTRPRKSMPSLSSLNCTWPLRPWLIRWFRAGTVRWAEELGSSRRSSSLRTTRLQLPWCQYSDCALRAGKHTQC